MPEIISIRATRKMAAAMSAGESGKLEALRSCNECGAEAAWGIGDEKVTYCEDHARWVDRDLAAQVNRAVEPIALANWLEQRPPTWRAKEETFGKEWTAENREALESWLRENRGDPVLVPYLEDWSPAPGERESFGRLVNAIASSRRWAEEAHAVPSRAAAVRVVG